jgi:hypothetical protein
MELKQKIDKLIEYKIDIEQKIDKCKNILRRAPKNSDTYDVIKAHLLYNFYYLDVFNTYLKTNIIDKDRIKRVHEIGIEYLDISSKFTDSIYLQTAKNLKMEYEILQGFDKIYY